MAAGTRDALIEVAGGLMRTKGYAAFSYADLADVVGIRKASIHHHFPSKEDLGEAIVDEYIAKTRDALVDLEVRSTSATTRLNGFVALFRSSASTEMLPLCGALAAEMSSLPESLQQLTKGFFDLQLTWLTKVIQAGIDSGELGEGVGATKKAFALLSLLEGSSFINWASQEEEVVASSLVDLIISQK